jgi:cathepsin B
MKVLFIAFALVAVASALPVWDEDAQPVLDDGLIDEINNSGAHWKAARNNRFDGMTMKDVKGLMGVRLDGPNADCPNPSEVFQPNMNDLPKNWDTRTEFPGMVHGVMNQEQCGSCWAFAASETLSDRTAIYTNGSVNEVLSPEALVECDKTDNGCGGGWPGNAAQYLVDHGIPTDTCVPYTSGGGSVSTCPTECIDKSPVSAQLRKYKSWEYCTGEAAMMQALQTGPIAVAFAVYQDFFSYSSGIYSHTSGRLAGYHAVKMVGYGVDGAVPYWIVQNSWGTSWGDKGFFKIKRGGDECGIEQGPLNKGCPIVGYPLV